MKLWQIKKNNFYIQADGNYSAQSDIDIIIISQNKKLKTKSLNRLEKEFGREIGLSISTLGEWRAMFKKKITKLGK